MSSSMLEQAIIDAKELKESAQRNAEETIVEKYQSEIKQAVEKILEQEDLGLGAGALGGGMGAGLGLGAPGKPESAKQPAGGEDQIDMVLEQLPFIQTTGDDQVIELDLGKLEESLNIVNEEEFEGLSEVELDEDLLDEYMLDEEFELDEDMLEEEFLDEEFELDEEMLEEEDLDEEMEKITPAQAKEATETLKAFGAQKAGEITEDLSLEEMIAEALEEMLGEEDVLEEDEDLFEIEDLEEAEEDKEGKGKKKVDLAGRKPPFNKVTPADFEGLKKGTQYVQESKKLQRENKTLIKEQTRMSSKVQLLEEKLDKYGTVIDQLKQKLDESNLASAKLLYQNRVLDSASLNERQKDKIVEAIKDAGTVEEAKIIFETLQSTVETSGKSGRRKESLDEVVYRGSSAFMPLKEAKQKVSDPFVARMQALAGLK